MALIIHRKIYAIPVSLASTTLSATALSPPPPKLNFRIVTLWSLFG